MCCLVTLFICRIQVVNPSLFSFCCLLKDMPLGTVSVLCASGLYCSIFSILTDCFFKVFPKKLDQV